MKKIFLLLGFVISVLHGMTQSYSIDDLNQSVFLYPDFYKGKALLKNKTTQQAVFNYNILFQQMIFVQGGTMMALDKISTIDTVYIDTVAFVAIDTVFYEMRLQHSSLPLFIRHEAEVSPSAPSTPFGGTSQTGAVQNVKTYRWSAATPYQLKAPENYNVKRTTKYFIKVNNELVQLKGSKQLKQLYPGKEKELAQFIKDNHIGFEKAPDMEKLTLFLATLGK